MDLGHSMPYTNRVNKKESKEKKRCVFFLGGGGGGGEERETGQVEKIVAMILWNKQKFITGCLSESKDFIST